MLWVDKYRPKQLQKLDYHPELSQRLQTLAEVIHTKHADEAIDTLVLLPLRFQKHVFRTCRRL